MSDKKEPSTKKKHFRRSKAPSRSYSRSRSRSRSPRRRSRSFSRSRSPSPQKDTNTKKEESKIKNDKNIIVVDTLAIIKAFAKTSEINNKIAYEIETSIYSEIDTNY